MEHISAAQTQGSATYGKEPAGAAKEAAIPFPTPRAKRDPAAKMLAIVWEGNKNVKVEEVPRLMLTDPGDALIRVTATTVCGSDLHLYHHEMSGLTKGDIMGHEAIGIVEAVGPAVSRFRPGDRVAISAVIACGACGFCKDQKYSLCDTVNNSTMCKAAFGQRLGGLFGYTQVMGGYDGIQCEYARVPLADVNLLKLAPAISDELAIMLSDILPTSFHANELGEVGAGDDVVVFGCGPIGLLSAMWARFRGARTVVSIDAVPERLALAKERVRVDHVLDYSQVDVVKAIDDILPGGPDVVIDAVGFRFPKSLVHSIQRLVRLETDSPQIANEAITIAKKGGRLVLIGDYYAMANGFLIGSMMEKGLRVTGGQLWCQKYWQQIQEWLLEKRIDPTFLVTHVLPFEEAARAYATFDTHADGAVKMVLKTRANPDYAAARGKVSLSSGPAVLNPLPGANMGNGRPMHGNPAAGGVAAFGSGGGALGPAAAKGGMSGATAGNLPLPSQQQGKGGMGTTGLSSGVAGMNLDNKQAAGGLAGKGTGSGQGTGLSSGLAGTTSTSRAL